MSQKLKIFIAGASGYTGLRLLPLLKNHTVYAHLRPESKNFETKKSLLENSGTIVLAHDLSYTENFPLKDCHVLVSLIGTTRAQFDAHTSYETADYGANISLMELAKKFKIPRFVLLSSVGADKGMGPYLKVKKKTEEALMQSGLDYTILRPSFFVGPGRRAAQLLQPFFSIWSFFSKKSALRYQAISIETLAQILLKIIEDNQKYSRCILEGTSLLNV